LTSLISVPQVESSLAVQSLKPRIDLIKKRFGEDKDKVSKETNLLYEQVREGDKGKGRARARCPSRPVCCMSRCD
jgi:hypothetical protein